MRTPLVRGCSTRHRGAPTGCRVPRGECLSRVEIQGHLLPYREQMLELVMQLNQGDLHVCKCTRACIHVYISVYACMCVRVHMCTNIRVYVYISV